MLENTTPIMDSIKMARISTVHKLKKIISKLLPTWVEDHASTFVSEANGRHKNGPDKSLINAGEVRRCEQCQSQEIARHSPYIVERFYAGIPDIENRDSPPCETTSLNDVSEP